MTHKRVGPPVVLFGSRKGSLSARAPRVSVGLPADPFGGPETR